jgi:hypothetical protein
LNRLSRQKISQLNEIEQEIKTNKALVKSKYQQLRALNKPLQTALLGRQGALLPAENPLDALKIDDCSCNKPLVLPSIINTPSQYCPSTNTLSYPVDRTLTGHRTHLFPSDYKYACIVLSHSLCLCPSACERLPFRLSVYRLNVYQVRTVHCIGSIQQRTSKVSQPSLPRLFPLSFPFLFLSACFLV